MAENCFMKGLLFCFLLQACVTIYDLYFCHARLFIFADVMSESFDRRKDMRGFMVM